MGDEVRSVRRRVSSSLEVGDHRTGDPPTVTSTASGGGVDLIGSPAPHTGMHAHTRTQHRTSVQAAIPLPQPAILTTPAIPKAPRAVDTDPQPSVLHMWRDPTAAIEDARLHSAYLQAGGTPDGVDVFVAATRHQLAEIKLHDAIESAFEKQHPVDSENPIWSAQTQSALRNVSEMITMLSHEFFPRSRAQLASTHATFLSSFQVGMPDREPSCTLREAMLQDMQRSITGAEIIAHLQEHANDSCGQTPNNVGIACLGPKHAAEFATRHNAWERHAKQSPADAMMLAGSLLSFGIVTQGHGVESLQAWTDSIAHAELTQPIFVRIGLDSPAEQGHGHQFALEIVPKAANAPLKAYIHMSWVGRFDEVMYARARGPTPDDLSEILGHLDAFCSPDKSTKAKSARLRAEQELFCVSQPELAFEAQRSGDHPPGLRYPEDMIREQGMKAIPELHCSWSACPFTERPSETDEAIGSLVQASIS